MARIGDIEFFFSNTKWSLLSQLPSTLLVEIAYSEYRMALWHEIVEHLEKRGLHIDLVFL
jgi:hypothetical protein